MFKHIGNKALAVILIATLSVGMNLEGDASTAKAEQVVEQQDNGSVTQQDENKNTVDWKEESVETISDGAVSGEINLPLETANITMQLRCKTEAYENLSLQLNEQQQSVLSGAGITALSWNVVSGNSIVSLEETTSYENGKTAAKVKGLKAGKATVQCYFKDMEGNINIVKSFVIQVLEKKTEVAFKKDQYIVPYSWYKTITPETASPNGKDVKVKYSSSNKKVATVDENGKVTGVAVGQATITAKAQDGSGVSDSFKVKVEKEKKGWHVTSTGKKYYVKANGTRSFGYVKVGSDYYYGNASSYMATNAWKYVKIDGKTYKLYFGKDGKQSQNALSVLGAQKKYKIEVNISTNTVIVYAQDGKKGFIIPVKAMVCSCGVKGHATITGTYSRLSRAGKWHTLYYGTYGKYCTRISGPYLFHSVVYSKNGDSYSLQADEYDKLGKLASHGCIRLSVKDAKWIYQNYSKCSVTLMKSNKKAPLKKPTPQKAVRLDNGKAYDPTDTDVK